MKKLKPTLSDYEKGKLVQSVKDGESVAPMLAQLRADLAARDAEIERLHRIIAKALVYNANTEAVAGILAAARKQEPQA